MRKNILRRNLFQSIRRSIGRYIAIAVIIALGAGMFVGLRSTRMDMVATGQRYTDEQNMFDLRLLTSYGWNKDQLDEIRKIDGLVDAEGLFYMDLIVTNENNDSDAVYRFYSIPETVNKIVLRGGRMPEKEDECLADGFRNNDKVLGTTITVAENNAEDSLEKIRYRTFTVVGYISTPLYMDMTRGNTSVGNGSISNYYFIPEGAFDVDYYTEIHATIPGDYKIYSDTYNDAMKDFADRIKPQLQPFAKNRLKKVRRDAEKAYQEAILEYEDGLRNFEEGKEEAEQKLKDAYQKYLDGQDELRLNERKLKDSEKQIIDGRKSIVDGKKTLAESRQTLANSKITAYTQMGNATTELTNNFRTANASLQQVDQALIPVSAALIQVNVEVISISNKISDIDTQIDNVRLPLDAVNYEIQSKELEITIAESSLEPDEAQIAVLHSELEALYAKRETINAEIAPQLAVLEGQKTANEVLLTEANTKKTQLEEQEKELLGQRQAIQNSLNQIEAGFLQLAAQQTAMEKQFAVAESQIQAGEARLAASETQLELFEKQISDGWAAIEDGKKELQDGYQKYKDAKADVKQELADAQAELDDAAEQLADARKTIDEMVKNDVIVLDRNSNIGYSSLDSSSNIVAAVSKVFPVFFLLVAALVCITTMTRMVDEERTQIGTLKALGYSNWAIISKYLFYAGSSAIVGCTMGVIFGSVVFPIVLWEAYKIMIYITPGIELCFNWPLCTAVVSAYTAVMLLVTWNCCRRELIEVPAELIRPKAPTAGKQLIFEKLSIWNRISFLNKVTIRNIFRYRQRLMMMLLGIGGCAALLLTGFGFRDSIMNIVSIQFDEVTTYDMEVYFRNGQSEEDQRKFCRDMGNYADNVLFFYQASAELDGESKTKDISLLVAAEEITDFIDFHKGKQPVDYPGINEVLISSGMAAMMDLKTGDTVTIRDLDLEVLNLTISGIYDNHVYNYAIISPETMEAQWGRQPDNQMAFINVKDGQDVFAAGAVVNSQEGVMNVTVSQELADMVGSMMEALNLVVLVIVFCAALLAAIVLYNLTNININERIREIATIKVLGFNAIETAMYVFKENLVLSVFGCAFGMLLGKLLLHFVIDQIRIDMIWLQPRLMVPSYFLSVIFTLMMAVIVDFVFYFRLDGINMAEALKSVE